MLTRDELSVSRTCPRRVGTDPETGRTEIPIGGRSEEVADNGENPDTCQLGSNKRQNIGRGPGSRRKMTPNPQSAPGSNRTSKSSDKLDSNEVTVGSDDGPIASRLRSRRRQVDVTNITSQKTEPPTTSRAPKSQKIRVTNKDSEKTSSKLDRIEAVEEPNARKQKPKRGTATIVTDKVAQKAKPSTTSKAAKKRAPLASSKHPKPVSSITDEVPEEQNIAPKKKRTLVKSKTSMARPRAATSPPELAVEADPAIIQTMEVASNDDPKYEDKVTDGTKNKIKLGLLNINSLGSIQNRLRTDVSNKMNYIRNYLAMTTMTILALTEYCNSDDDLMDVHLSNYTDFVILSVPSCKRCGLAIPNFLKDRISIIDSWFLLSERRKMKNSERVVVEGKVCQSITFKLLVRQSQILIFTVIYIVPDIVTSKLNDVMVKINDYVEQFKGTDYIVLGDLNIDQRVETNSQMVKQLIHHDLTQVVKQITRVGKRTTTVNGKKKTSTSNTIIDLVFINQSVKMIGCPKVIRDTPSDHFLVETTLDYSIPSVYKIEEYYLDPTQRPPIKPSKIAKAKDLLCKILGRAGSMIRDSTHSEGMQIIENSLVTVLNKFCPMNSSDMQTKKTYRIVCSKETDKLRDKKRKLLRKRDKLSRRIKQNPRDKAVLERHSMTVEKLKIVTKDFKKSLQKDKLRLFEDDCNKYITHQQGIWEFSKTCDQKAAKRTEPLILKNKQGVELANHMKDYMNMRANLVEQSVIDAHSEYVPLSKKKVEVYHTVKNYLDPRKLYFPTGKKPSLACGPDTISHRHIYDLFEVLEPWLGIIVNKPIDNFHNASTNFTRLIPKPGKPEKGKEEKLFRPICQANILTKCGSYRPFTYDLKDLITPAMNTNQYSFPKKGCPIAVAELFDDLNHKASSKRPMLYAQFDMSNAFCTYNHKTLMQIFRSYQLPENMLDLCEKFMNQSTTTFKINDVNGYYLSDQDTTNCGGPQGQIGTDLFFSVANDGMNPILLDETQDEACRKKYVDDSGDSYVSATTESVFNLLYKNVDLLKKQCNSTALSLNEGKTNVMPYNCDSSLVEEEMNKKKVKISFDTEILGFMFKFNDKPENLKISTKIGVTSIKVFVNTDASAEAMINKLKFNTKKVITSRKVIPSIHKRVNLATGLVHASCTNLAICSIFSSKKMMDDVYLKIRNMIKSAGLDYRTPTEELYKISLGMSPEMIAKKQIIQIGIKNNDMVTVQNNRYNVRRSRETDTKPLQSAFAIYFNELPTDLRHKICYTYNGVDLYHTKMDKIKALLKSHFRTKFCGKNFDDKEKSKLIVKNKYSLQKVKKLRDETRSKRLNSLLENDGNHKDDNGSCKHQTLKKGRPPDRGVITESDSE